MSRLALLIPAYRPDAPLPGVVAGVVSADPDRLVERIVVVDDGSGPAYAGMLDRVRAIERVEILTRTANGGKGVALKQGIASVLASGADLSGLVTADADGQHTPADILRVARALADRPDRLVLGARRFDRQVPLRSRFGNVVTRRLVAWRTGVALQDSQTGLRGWPLAWCHELVTIPGERYEWEMATLLAVIHRPIVEVPIRTVYTGERSHFQPLRDSFRIYCTAARLLARRDRCASRYPGTRC